MEEITIKVQETFYPNIGKSLFAVLVNGVVIDSCLGNAFIDLDPYIRCLTAAGFKVVVSHEVLDL